jgi:hypothetical protein
MMGMDRSELVEQLIRDHLKRFVVSDRGGGSPEVPPSQTSTPVASKGWLRRTAQQHRRTGGLSHYPSPEDLSFISRACPSKLAL